MTLAGFRILVTRPEHQAAELTRLLTEAGAETLLLPVLAIEAVAVSLPEKLENYQWALFTSANAVEHSSLLLNPLPSELQLVSIGKKTTAALQHVFPNRPIVTAPPPYHSESLLSLPEFQQLDGQQVVIFTGEGGRDVLATTLTARGAQVSVLAVYRRIKPVQSVRWLETAGRIDAIIVTSNEGLQNLFQILADFRWLPHTPLILISERMVATARRLGSTALIWVAPEASDVGLLQAVANFVNSRVGNDKFVNPPCSTT